MEPVPNKMLNNSDLCVALTAAENSVVNCIQISSFTTPCEVTIDKVRQTYYRCAALIRHFSDSVI